MKLYAAEVGATRTRSNVYYRFFYAADDAVVDHTALVADVLRVKLRNGTVPWPSGLAEIGRLSIIIRQRMGYGLAVI